MNIDLHLAEHFGMMFGMISSWWLTNPFEKYASQNAKWESSPGKGENKKYVKPPHRVWLT